MSKYMNPAVIAICRLKWCIAEDRQAARKRRHDKRPMKRSDAQLLLNNARTRLLEFLSLGRTR